MDGFPPPVTMGSLISTILQMKSQMDFMDQFMSLYVPEYVQLKNYAIETQQQTGMASVAPTVSSYPLSVSSFQQDPGMGMPSFTTTAPSASKSCTGHQVVTNNIKYGVGNQIGPPGKTKVRRKQTLVKTTTSASSPSAALKRRGRKRKYPIPSENTVTNGQNVKEATQSSENVITVNGAKTDTISTADNKKNLEPSNDNHGSNGRKIMSSLDILAAVSYVLKQKEGGDLAVVQGIPSNSVDPSVGNVDQQTQQHMTTVISLHHQDNQNLCFSQNNSLGDLNNNSQQNCCRTGERQDPQPSLSQARHHHGYQTAGEQFQANIMHKIQSSSSSSVLLSNEMPDLSDSQQEGYNSIFESSPQQELIV